MRELKFNKLNFICKDYVKRMVQDYLDPIEPDWSKKQIETTLEQFRSGEWSEIETLIDNEWYEDYYMGDETKLCLDYFCATGAFDRWFNYYKNKELKKLGSK